MSTALYIKWSITGLNKMGHPPMSDWYIDNRVIRDVKDGLFRVSEFRKLYNSMTCQADARLVRVLPNGTEEIVYY